MSRPRSTWYWIKLAWQERATDFTTSDAWGVPAYERTRRFLLWLRGDLA